MSYVGWLLVATLWIATCAGVGALLARAAAVPPVVGAALSIVLGPIGWVGLPLARRSTAKALASASIEAWTPVDRPPTYPSIPNLPRRL
jgi:hypothetical protein